MTSDVLTAAQIQERDDNVPIHNMQDKHKDTIASVTTRVVFSQCETSEVRLVLCMQKHGIQMSEDH